MWINTSLINVTYLELGKLVISCKLLALYNIHACTFHACRFLMFYQRIHCTYWRTYCCTYSITAVIQVQYKYIGDVLFFIFFSILEKIFPLWEEKLRHISCLWDVKQVIFALYLNSQRGPISVNVFCSVGNKHCKKGACIIIGIIRACCLFLTLWFCQMFNEIRYKMWDILTKTNTSFTIESKLTLIWETTSENNVYIKNTIPQTLFKASLQVLGTKFDAIHNEVGWYQPRM